MTCIVLRQDVHVYKIQDSRFDLNVFILTLIYKYRDICLGDSHQDDLSSLALGATLDIIYRII